MRAAAALARAEELAHPASLARARFYACALSQLVGDRRAVQEEAKVLLALASEQGFAYWAGCAMVLEGWSLADGERASDGIATYRATGATLLDLYFLALLAQAQRRRGELPAAEETTADALGRMRTSGVRHYEAELLRLRGEQLLARSPPDPIAAEGCLVEALETARRQRAKMWELRAALSLARQRRGQGRLREARDLLAPIHGWFTEGLNMPDLIEAKALLGELQ